MADEAQKTAQAAPKKKRAAFTRKPQSLFLILRTNDGTPLSAENLSYEVTKDTAKLVQMLTGPGGTGGAAVLTIEVPVASKPAPASV